jgi:hypothetical protein
MAQDHIAGDIERIRRSLNEAPDGQEVPGLFGRLVLTKIGNVGLAIFPGQSPGQVLAAAEVIQRELDVDRYLARDVARQVIQAITAVAQETR